LTLIEALASGLPVITTDHPPMNEFVEVNRNGRLVDVARLVARFDGYYWPQSFIKPASLTEQMRFYLDNRGRLAEFKSQARQYAEEKLDWRKNSAHLADDLIQAKREPDPVVYATSRRKAEAFERQRRTLVQKYPRLAGLLLPMYQRLVKR
jgi:glycosyltransferase involved in cell wall biosynthesis